MLFFGLVPVLIFPAVYSGSPIDLVSLVMMAALGIVCLILFALFARGIVLSGSSATEGARS
jgi:hypothetical protein